MAKLSNQDRKKIEHRLKLAQIHKKSVVDYLENLKKNYEKKMISNEGYAYEMEKEIDGRTLEDWIRFYDSYIGYCIKKLK